MTSGFMDLGKILAEGKTTELSEKQKAEILEENKLPPLPFVYPRKAYTQKTKSGTNTRYRACSNNLMTKHLPAAEDLHYSIEKDSIFCLVCAFFPSNSSRYNQTLFTKKGFNDWKNSEKIKQHLDSDQHGISSKGKFEFICSLQQGTKISRMYKTAADENRKFTSAALKASVEVVKKLGTQGLAFRGHREHEDGNKGNFNSLIKLVSLYSPEVRGMLLKQAEKKGSITMFSWKIQNSLIKIIGIAI